MSTLETIAKVRAIALEAATRPERWSDVVGELAVAIGCSGAHIFSPDSDPAARHLAAQWGSVKETQAEYLGQWAKQDPWFLSALERGLVRSGLALSGQDLMREAELHRTEFYNEFGRRAGCHELVALNVYDGSSPDAPATILSFMRPEGSAPFADEHKRMLQALWPDVSRALLGYWKLRKALAFGGVIEGTLDALAQPAWVLRADMAIDYENLAARRLAANDPSWLRATAKRLLAIGDADMALLARAAQDGYGAGSVPARHGPIQARLRWTPVAEGSPHALAWPCARLLLTLEMPPARESSEAAVATLARLLRLTASERRVLGQLAAGSPPADICDRLRIAPTTLRSHVRALLEKSGCQRRVDLVRLVVGGPR